MICNYRVTHYRKFTAGFKRDLEIPVALYFADYRASRNAQNLYLYAMRDKKPCFERFGMGDEYIITCVTWEECPQIEIADSAVGQE